jgi:replicative superfamily II helicase
MALTEQQWGDIRTLWTATDKPIREIAREFGCSEGAIRKKAGKEVWGPRNASAVKRSIVEAAMAGARKGTRRGIEGEADQDIEDMLLAARVGRKVLQRCEYLLDEEYIDEEGRKPPVPVARAPKDIKCLAEGARAAMEMIRKARNLDAPAPPPPEASPLDALAASLAQARKDRLLCA